MPPSNRKMNPRGLFSRLVSSLVFLLANVHLSVVKLDRATGRAADGVARLVVIPPAVTVPGDARVVGSHRVVRLATTRDPAADGEPP